MTEFTIKAGQFYLDDQPVLIQAGEVHYFRIPREAWRHRLELLKSAGFNALATYIPWLWHQPEEGVSDFDGRSHPLRDLAGFLDLAAEMGLWIIARPGPYIMAETINEGIPPWVFASYPQAAFISQDGKPQNIASYLHPDFLACVQGWYRAVFEVLAPRQVTRGGRILLIQLDNEMGMIQWVRNMLDINPDTLRRFARYVQESYGAQLRQRYPAEPLEDLLRDGITNPQSEQACKVVEDYRRFYRLYLRDYALFLRREAARRGMETPPVINIHGFMRGGKTFPIGLSQLIEVMRLDGMLSATDVYPLFIGEGNFHQLLMVNEMTRALQNPQQPLFSIEFQAGGNNDFGGGQSSLYDLHTRLCLSAGMRAFNHYLFCDGENDPLLSPIRRHDWGHPARKDGSLRQHYHRYPKLSRVLEAYGADLTLAQPQYSTTIGFLLDHFMTEVNTPATQPLTEILNHQRETILFDFIARGLALTHRPFDAVELSQAALDPARTPVLWVMMEQVCAAPVQQKLVDYAQAGGSLVLVGRLCQREADDQDCRILQQALGIRQVQSDPPFTQGAIHAFQYHDVPASFIESYSGEFDEVFAWRSDGAAVGVMKHIGKGRALLFGAALAANTLEDLDIFEQIAARMGCQPMFSLSSWADVRLSRGKRGSFFYINNYQDDPLETTVADRSGWLFGGNPLRLAARSGMILPREWQPAAGVRLHYLTAEATGVRRAADRLTIHVAQPAFTAELSLHGWRCPAATPLGGSAGRRRYRLDGTDGVIEVVKEGG